MRACSTGVFGSCLRLCAPISRPLPLQRKRKIVSEPLKANMRAGCGNAGMSSFRGEGIVREPGIPEHGHGKLVGWPVFMPSGPGPDGPSRNDMGVFCDVL